MPSLGWFHDELVLSDAGKLEYVPGTAKRACRLIPQSVETEDFVGNALPAGWTELDSGGLVNFQNGRMEIASDGVANTNGVYTSQRALAPAKVTFELYFPDADVSGSNGKHQMGFHTSPLSLTSVYAMFYCAGSHAGSNLGGAAAALDGLVTQTTYTLRLYYAYECKEGLNGWKVTIQGGVFTAETLIGEGSVPDADLPANIYIQWTTWKTSMAHYIDNLVWLMGYDTGGADGSVVKDAGAGETWDGSELATMAASLALPDGHDYTNVTLDHSYDDGSASWTTGQTLAQLKTAMEAISTDKRYFRLKGKLNSDGDTQVVMMLPNMPDVPLVASGGVIGGPNKRAGKQ